MSKKTKYMILAALAVGWAVDLLFWKHSVGINFTIWVAVILAAALLLSRSEGVKPARWSVVLLVVIVLMAVVPFLRWEGLTRFLAACTVVGGILLLAATWGSGFWLFFRIRDYFVSAFKLVAAGLTRGAELLRTQPGEAGTNGSGLKRTWRAIRPVLLGVVITIPVLMVLGSLLSSADLVFAERMKRLLEIFDLRKLPEYVFRLFYILLFAYLAGGLLLHAFRPLKEEAKPNPDAAWFKPFLGWTETVILLVSVVAMFAFFVIIQAQYFFGGQANINVEGYTYAEYARRGFNELVVVAVLSLALYLLLATISKREKPAYKRLFSILSVAMFALVGVMLFSAMQRLLLYESAYGFTQLRTYTHFFIPWLGALLLAVVVLELMGKRGRVPLALLAVCIGFAATLAVVNVDGYIARQNIARAVDGEELDTGYLSSLSVDAVPAMVSVMEQPELPAVVRDGVGAELACRAVITAKMEKTAWQSFHLAEWRAERLLVDKKDLWKDYRISLGNMDPYWQVLVNGEYQPCNEWYGWMD